MTAVLDAEAIRAKRADAPKMRDRDVADQLGISEAELVAAHCGHGALRIDAHPDVVMGAALRLGPVMALTRNPSCVHEKIGVYENYHPGYHAAMILTEDIDLRIFPSHWCHAYWVEQPGESAAKRSLQVFDAAGDAVHKIFLREGSDLAVWDALKAERALDDQTPRQSVEARKPPEAPKSIPAPGL